jgi:hypothetical protein
MKTKTTVKELVNSINKLKTTNDLENYRISLNFMLQNNEYTNFEKSLLNKAIQQKIQKNNLNE